MIDFGLAKATSGLQLSEHSLFTAFGTVAGTPLYMAPEQASFNALDVDTRADIYALGVILYELLTGSTPIQRETFKQAALDEMLRVIREVEPPTPSSRISTSEALPSDRRDPSDRAGAAGPVRAGRPRLDRDEGAGEGAAAALRVGDRAWRRTSSGSRTTSRSAPGRRRPVTGCGSSCGGTGRRWWRRRWCCWRWSPGSWGRRWGWSRRNRQQGDRRRRAGARPRSGSPRSRRPTRSWARSSRTSTPRNAEKEGKPLAALLGERLDQATAQIEGESIGDPLAVARMQQQLGECSARPGLLQESAQPLLSSARDLRNEARIRPLRYAGLRHRSRGLPPGNRRARSSDCTAGRHGRTCEGQARLQ